MRCARRFWSAGTLTRSRQSRSRGACAPWCGMGSNGWPRARRPSRRCCALRALPDGFPARATMTAQNYYYKAVDAHGVSCTGELNAVSRASALDVLSRRGLIPISIGEGAAGRRIPRPGLSRFSPVRRARRGQIRAGELLNLTQSLAALSRAGLTIDRALQITASLAVRASSRGVAETLLREVRSGKTPHAAVAAGGQRLPNYYVSMVEAGELGGSP